MSTKKIYIDFQSLLDLRQSILIELMGTEAALEYITTDEYNFREVDVFPVDMNEYKKKQEDTSNRRLQNATLTYMEVLLKNKLASLEKLNGFNGESDSPELIVNTYPYQLTAVQAKLMKEAIFIRLKVEVRITFVFDHPSIWSPSYIKNNNITSFFMYDFSGWMRLHSEKLKSGDLREVNVFFPSVGHKALEKEEIKNLKSLGFTDIFAYMEYVMASACRIQFLPIVFYTNLITATAILNKNKDIVEGQMSEEIDKQRESVEKALDEKGYFNDDLKQSNPVS